MVGSTANAIQNEQSSVKDRKFAFSFQETPQKVERWIPSLKYYNLRAFFLIYALQWNTLKSSIRNLFATGSQYSNKPEVPHADIS